MGSTNFGLQDITYDFRQEARSQSFNRLNYLLHPPGIFEGGVMSINDGPNAKIDITKFTCFITNLDPLSPPDLLDRVGARVETTIDVINFQVIPSRPLVVLQFEWLNTENNFLNIENVDQTDFDQHPEWLLLGECLFSGPTLIGFDFTRKSRAVLPRLSDPDVFYISENNKFGLHTDSPLTTLHIFQSGTTSTTHGIDEGLIVQNSDTGKSVSISLIGKDSANVYFGDEDDFDIGKILYDHSDNHMAFFTNNGERIRILNNY